MKTSAPPDSCPTTGWIACSSDEILATKEALSDIRVKMTSLTTDLSSNHGWPEIVGPDGGKLYASQRDLRRYITLRQCISRSQADEEEAESHDGSNDRTLLLPAKDLKPPRLDIEAGSGIVEPESWASMAYSSYVLWASAADRSSALDDEVELDTSMFEAAPGSSDGAKGPYERQSDMQRMPEVRSDALPRAVLAYFQRLTTMILTTLMDIVEVAGPDVAGEGEHILVSREDMQALGLDPHSKGDRVWVCAMLEVYFGRRATVQVVGIECCGVKLY